MRYLHYKIMENVTFMVPSFTYVIYGGNLCTPMSSMVEISAGDIS